MGDLPLTETPVGKYMKNMLATAAQFENDVRSEQSKDGMVNGVKNGRWMWQAPMGYRNSGGRKTSNLIPEEPFAGHIRRAFELVGKGYTPQEAANVLKRDGFRTKAGKTVGIQKVGKILRNPLYKGVIEAFGKSWPGSYVPLVEAELFDRVQAIIDSRNNKQPKYLMQREDFPLRGFLVHSCGKRYMGSWSKGRTKRYAHYHCRFCKKTNISQTQVHSEFDGFIAQHALKPELAALLKIAIEENMRSASEETDRKRLELSRRIRELQGEQDAIAQKNISGVLDDDTARRMVAEKKEAHHGVRK